MQGREAKASCRQGIVIRNLKANSGRIKTLNLYWELVKNTRGKTAAESGRRQPGAGGRRRQRAEGRWKQDLSSDPTAVTVRFTKDPRMTPVSGVSNTNKVTI